MSKSNFFSTDLRPSDVSPAGLSAVAVRFPLLVESCRDQFRSLDGDHVRPVTHHETHSQKGPLSYRRHLDIQVRLLVRSNHRKINIYLSIKSCLLYKLFIYNSVTLI